MITATHEVMEELDEVLEQIIGIHERIEENLANALSFQRQVGLTDDEIVTKTGLSLEFVAAALAAWETWPIWDAEADQENDPTLITE